MNTSLDDLLAPPVPEEPALTKRGTPRKKMGRPTKEEALAKAEAADEPLPHYSVFRKPVGITFLASVVGKQPKQIAKRLEKCPVAEWGKNQSKSVPLYDFLTAMAYLIPPRGNIEDWFAQQNAASLPPYVNKMWWDSASQRNRTLLQSNDLWHTEDVMVVFGRVAMTIRQEVKMWVEDLPEKELLTDQQYTALIDAGNRLVDSIREVLMNLDGKTPSMSQQITDELDAAGQIADADRNFEDGDE